MHYTVLFLGRSIEGILSDARRLLGDAIGSVLVVTRDDENLSPPDGLPAVTVSNFDPLPGCAYTVVANGGTASQLAPVLMRLCYAGVPLKVLDLQRDGVHTLQ